MRKSLHDVLVDEFFAAAMSAWPPTGLPLFSLASPRPYKALGNFVINRNATLKSAIANSRRPNLRYVSPRESNIAATFGSSRIASLQSANLELPMSLNIWSASVTMKNVARQGEVSHPFGDAGNRDRNVPSSFRATTFVAENPMQAANASTRKSLRRAWRPGAESCGRKSRVRAAAKL